MRTVRIPNFLYKGDLAQVLADVEFVLSDEDYERFQQGTPIEDLEGKEMTFAMVAELETKAMMEYYLRSHQAALAGTYRPKAWEIRAIAAFFGIPRVDLARLLALDKGSLSNLINDKSAIGGSTAFLLLERLGMELARPGAMKAMAGASGEPPKVSRENMERIDQARFGRVA